MLDVEGGKFSGDLNFTDLMTVNYSTITLSIKMVVIILESKQANAHLSKS